MNIELICGIMAGIALSLSVFILIIKWRRGRAGRKGRKGEKIVAKELKRLKKRDSVVLNDLLIPVTGGKTSQIDHVVVSTRGIFVIETKSLEGRISGTEHTQYWQQHLSNQSRQFYNPLMQNSAHVRNLRKIMSEIPEEWWVSVVVFTTAWRLDVRAEDVVIRRWWGEKRVERTLRPSEKRKRHWWSFGKEVILDDNKLVLSIEELIEEIQRRKRVIPREKVEEIAIALRGAAAQTETMRAGHTEYVQSVSSGTAEKIRSRICPRCGGELTIRKLEGSEFVGCSNYPRCRFTCPIDRLRNY